MTRLNDRLVVQRVDDRLVIVDQSTGAEIVFDEQMRVRLTETVAVLFANDATAWMVARPVEGERQVWNDWDGVAYSDRTNAVLELADANKDRGSSTAPSTGEYRLYSVTEVR